MIKGVKSYARWDSKEPQVNKVMESLFQLNACGELRLTENENIQNIIQKIYFPKNLKTGTTVV